MLTYLILKATNSPRGTVNDKSFKTCCSTPAALVYVLFNLSAISTGCVMFVSPLINIFSFLFFSFLLFHLYYITYYTTNKIPCQNNKLVNFSWCWKNRLFWVVALRRSLVGGAWLCQRLSGRARAPASTQLIGLRVWVSSPYLTCSRPNLRVHSWQSLRHIPPTMPAAKIASTRLAGHPSGSCVNNFLANNFGTLIYQIKT